MNLKKCYLLAALALTAPIVYAATPQARILDFANQAPSVATFTNLANALRPLGTGAGQLPQGTRGSILTKYGVDVVTIAQMDPTKIAALALLETALTNYQASHSVADAEDVVDQAMTVGNENPILKIFGPSVEATIADAHATIAGHTATTRAVAATVPGAEADLRHVATYLAEIEPINGANQVDPADDIATVGAKAQLLVNDVNQDVMNAKFYLDHLRIPGPLSASTARPFNPAVANGGPLRTTIKEIFAKQIQDMMQPHAPTTLQQIAHLTGITDSTGANPGTVPALLDPAITANPNDFITIRDDAKFFTQWIDHALISTDAELVRVATPLAPAFTLPANDTLEHRTTALLNHLAGPGARSATLDAYLNGLRPHGAPLTTSCGLNAARNTTGNTAQIITDVRNSLTYPVNPTEIAGGITAMQDILQSLNLDYTGLTTTDDKVDYVIKKLLFDQYKTFMWLTKNSGTPGTDYPGTPATAGVGNIAQARITQLNNALRGFHAGTGGAVLPTGQDHQLVTLGNSLQTALDTKLTSCSTANLFTMPAEVNVPNLVIAVNEMKDVITTLAPAGTPATAGTTAQLVDAIKKNIVLPLVTNYIDANNIASSFIDFTEINAGTPNKNKTIQNNIKEIAWTLQSLAHAANLRNGTAAVPAPAAFDATTYAGIPGVALGDKLQKATLVQDIVDGIKATVVAAPAVTPAAAIPTTLTAPFYTGSSDISGLLGGCTQAILAPSTGVNQTVLTNRITDACSIIHDLGNGIGGGVFNKATLTNHLKKKQHYYYAIKIDDPRGSAIVINGAVFNNPATYRAGLEDIRNLFGTPSVTLTALPVPFATGWNSDASVEEVREIIGGTIVLLTTIDTMAGALGTTPRIRGTNYASLSDLFKRTQDTLTSIMVRARATTPSATPSAGAALPPQVMQHNAYVDSLKGILNFRDSLKPLMLVSGANAVTLTTAICGNAPLLFTPATGTDAGPGKYNLTEIGKSLLGTSAAIITPAGLKTLFKSKALQLFPTIQALQAEATALALTHPAAVGNIKTFKLESGGVNWAIPTPLPSAPTALPDDLGITIINA